MGDFLLPPNLTLFICGRLTCTHVSSKETLHLLENNSMKRHEGNTCQPDELFDAERTGGAIRKDEWLHKMFLAIFVVLPKDYLLLLLIITRRRRTHRTTRRAFHQYTELWQFEKVSTRRTYQNMKTLITLLVPILFDNFGINSYVWHSISSLVMLESSWCAGSAG